MIVDAVVNFHRGGGRAAGQKPTDDDEEGATAVTWKAR